MSKTFWLCAGIADALITKIGQSGQSHVRPPSAVRKCAAQGSDPLGAARHLDAEAALAGSLQQSGDRIRASVQLLNSTRETIFTESFAIPSGDVFTVQDEIARQVADQLRWLVSGGFPPPTTRREIVSEDTCMVTSCTSASAYGGKSSTPSDRRRGSPPRA